MDLLGVFVALEYASTGDTSPILVIQSRSASPSRLASVAAKPLCICIPPPREKSLAAMLTDECCRLPVFPMVRGMLAGFHNLQIAECIVERIAVHMVHEVAIRDRAVRAYPNVAVK
jgi:hypothetical protein